MAELSAMYSSKSDEWATPQGIYDQLDAEFNFNLDPCATDANHKCKDYYTAEQDGLKQNWGGGAYIATRHTATQRHGLRKHFTRLSRKTR